MYTLRRLAPQSLLTLLLVVPVAAQDPPTSEEQPPAGAQDEQPPVDALEIPEVLAEALDMSDDLEEVLEDRKAAELQELLEAWMMIVRRQELEVERGLAAPEGSPEYEAAVTLRSDLDLLLAGADAIAGAVARLGVDVSKTRDEISVLRSQDTAALAESTVPPNRHLALELPVEVLKAQLRPLTRAQTEAQLGQWLLFLQRTCLEVRNVEVSALQAVDPDKVESFNERAVALRGERAALIKRVTAVITALERKGGDVEEARAFVGSVIAKPPITGLRAAWTTLRAWTTDKEGGVALAKSGGVALGILVAFWLLAKLLTGIARRATRSLTRASELLREFIISSVQRLTILIGLLIALSTLGINMTPLVAAIGAAGLVIGLALQGTLGNLASGLMIMVYRPFDVGDVVAMSGVTGKVDGMTLMTTSVKTFDNQTIHVPNNKIWGDVITNVTANDTRRVDMTFGISYSDDISKAKGILARLVEAHSKVLADPAPNIRVHQLGDSSVNLIVRPWSLTADYWDVYWDLTEEVKRTFDAEGISIPFPQRDVHVIPAPSPLDSAPPGRSEPQQPDRAQV